jgi:hypothetical protein
MAVEVTTNAVAISGGKPETLFPAPPDLAMRGTDFSGFMQSWDVRKDGSRFLITTPVAESLPMPFNLILNWNAPLKK